jgi:hypothetical protein
VTADRELAEALHKIAGDCDPPLGWHDQEQILSRLLPVVERAVAAARAEALSPEGLAQALELVNAEGRAHPFYQDEQSGESRTDWAELAKRLVKAMVQR